MYRSYLALFLLFMLCRHTVSAQLGVSDTMTPQQLVQSILVGADVTAFNITYTGAPLAIGSFANGQSTNLGFGNGVVLTSGDVNNAPGPNTTGGVSTNNNLPGDPDLDVIMSPTPSYDAAILEFDFIPSGDTLTIRYVFASEEYPEFVSPTPGGINDGFGFFISGITTSMPPTNIALVPNTTNPVTMYNVNCQNGSPYYICNDPENNNSCNTFVYNCPSSSAATTIQYDGFTVILNATSPVIPGETYHMKIAIGDGGDHVFDSGLFIEAGSFNSGGGTVTSTGNPVKAVDHFYIPNSFTPNGDGLNDIFSAAGAGVKEYQVNIYNRLGNLVFKSDNRSAGWDGRAAGGLAEPGVYIAVFDIEADVEGEQRIRHIARVTLIR